MTLGSGCVVQPEYSGWDLSEQQSVIAELRSNGTATRTSYIPRPLSMTRGDDNLKNLNEQRNSSTRLLVEHRHGL